MMKVEAAVFPFHEKMLPFVRHFNQAQDTYHICQALAWNGVGLSGHDVAYICCHPSLGIPVVSPTNPEAFLNWRTLLIDYDALENISSSFEFGSFFERLLSLGKELIVTTKKNNLLCTGTWNTLYQKYSNQIRIFSSQNIMRENSLANGNRYKSLSVPVLIVGGLITQEDSLEVILAIRESFASYGETVSCIVESNMSLLMGMHSYTHIFDKAASLSEEDKAIALNKTAQDIINVEHPSLLIVEAPDPMLKYNNIVPNGFGLQTYITCQALKPDMMVCSVPFDIAIEADLLNLVSQDFKRRYGTPITAIHASNVVVDSFDIMQFHQITRFHIDSNRINSFLKQKCRGQTIPVFNVISDKADELASFILQKREAL